MVITPYSCATLVPQPYEPCSTELMNTTDRPSDRTSKPPEQNSRLESDHPLSTAIAIQNLSKHYPGVVALDDISLSIYDKEFFTLLGPSGCGKTTLLRIIAGFESVTAGNVHLHGQSIADLPANKRPVNTVFQQYSLFPHMNVADNIKFGMQMKGSSSTHIDQRCEQMLALVQLSDYATRKPSQLSGGQAQRVALARALAPEPEVLLLDEPLSALDLKLRQAMRLELKQIQQETGITFIFVTHDQEEALTMSDRIAVMSAGKVQQIGSPHDIYEEPQNRFVADFIGETNMLDSTVVQVIGSNESENNESTHDLVCDLTGLGEFTASSSTKLAPGTRGSICIRPERIRILEAGHADAHLNGTLEQLVYMGTDTQATVKLANGEPLLVRSPNNAAQRITAQPGDPVGIGTDKQAARFLVD